jgi:Flp pilus assembly protein TadB
MNQLNTPPTPPRSQKEPSGSSWAIGLLAIPMVLCCGLPLIVAGLATASALTKGVLVGVVVAIVGTVVTLLVRRSMRNKAECCVPPRTTARSPESREVDHRR